MDLAWFEQLPPPQQALVAGLLTWGVTAVGAACVFVTSRINRKLLDGLLGFAAGVMMAASYWSLLAPSIEIAGQSGLPGWWPALCGMLAGVGVLWIRSTAKIPDYEN
ncbi:MAG: ZIP family metal transporter [Planctomycetaceae bacterium]